MANTEENYHQTRFKFDPERVVVWRAITEYLQPYVGQDKAVLDLGAGYGDFINLIQAKKKYALDIGPAVKDYISEDVEFINKPASSLEDIPSNSLDAVFSSNLLEHLDRSELDETMTEVRKRLKSGGTLILVGPNYRYAYKNYFDDYTHKTIFTHVSMVDAMHEYGFKPVKVVPKFIPLTMKSRLPKSYWLTKTYLHSPVHPLAKQMLLIFEATDGK